MPLYGSRILRALMFSLKNWIPADERSQRTEKNAEIFVSCEWQERTHFN